MDNLREIKTVNCYFCGDEFDDRECSDADEFSNDGGSICAACLEQKEDGAREC